MDGQRTIRRDARRSGQHHRRAAPSQIQERGQTVTAEERQKREATIRALAERWPKCFAVNEKQRRPLKVGIGEEVRVLLPDVEVSAALAFYAHNTNYMKALVAGAIGLDGEPAGVVTAEQEAFAWSQLAAIQNRRETKPAPQQETKPQSDAARRPTLSLPSLRPKPNS
jgi:ProP effector